MGAVVIHELCLASRTRVHVWVERDSDVVSSTDAARARLFSESLHGGRLDGSALDPPLGARPSQPGGADLQARGPLAPCKHVLTTEAWPENA